MDLSNLLAKIYLWLTTVGIRAALILLGGLVVYLAVNAVIRKLITRSIKLVGDEENRKRAETLMRTGRSLLLLVLGVTLLIMIISEFGVDIGPLLAAAGVLGIAVGFGAQNLVKDLISGIFILLDDQIRVGDVVEIAGRSGTVEQVGLRLVVIRDAAGNVHFIPNSSIDVVTNMTKDFSRYIFEIGVAYKEDVDRVMETIKDIDRELRAQADFSDDIMEPLEVLGLDSFGASAVIIRARYVTRPGRQWRVGREFNRRLKIRFDRDKIEIPFPHLTIFNGNK
ncbi:MAG: mechanosensitive ion channel family protein [Candidatus Neomarinimicrobiota bacterium]